VDSTGFLLEEGRVGSLRIGIKVGNPILLKQGTRISVTPGHDTSIGEQRLHLSRSNPLGCSGSRERLGGQFEHTSETEQTNGGLDHFSIHQYISFQSPNKGA